MALSAVSYRLSAGPTETIGRPRYPTRLEVQVSPGLLLLHQPPAWRGRRDLAHIAGFLLATGATACERAPNTASGVAATNPASTSAQFAQVKPADSAARRPDLATSTPTAGPSQAQTGTLVTTAPLFRHGEGLGATGCVVVHPPAFLSEEEALALITDELKKNGVNLTEHNTFLPGLTVPVSSYQAQLNWVTGEHRMQVQRGRVPLAVDGFDPQLRIAVEFASRRDFRELHGPWIERISSTAYVVESKAVAEWLLTEVGSQSGWLYFGAFYDPCMLSDLPIDYERLQQLRRAEELVGDNEILHNEANEISSRLEAGRRLTKAQAEDQLRLQVRDFVAWLKAQGAL